MVYLIVVNANASFCFVAYIQNINNEQNIQFVRDIVVICVQIITPLSFVTIWFSEIKSRFFR